MSLKDFEVQWNYGQFSAKVNLHVFCTSNNRRKLGKMSENKDRHTVTKMWVEETIVINILTFTDIIIASTF